ncbi:MAG: class I SAM-dependent methyltransferase [Christensenellaceae bacterium]|nr:class I SAM-dependent methyltransferase [Christensenellaceae bacterium]
MELTDNSLIHSQLNGELSKLHLDERLQALLSYIDCDTLADIGCDHGKISLGAILSRKAKFVVAADISKSCLEKAITLANNFNLRDKIKFFVSNGFQSITRKVDQAVIAGMGGIEITKIMSHENCPSRLILAPHSKCDILREHISCNNYRIVCDNIVKSQKKFYPVIVLEKSSHKPCYCSSELMYGKNLPQSPYFIEMLLEQKGKLEKILLENKNENIAKNLAMVMELLKF